MRFFASPFVLARAVSLSVGEIVKELYQARRQRVRDVVPRISRAGWYVVLRGVTNVLLRDLNTSLVAEALVRGDPTVYVDLVDYDEVAHHAGPTRPESLRSLEGLDRVLGTLEQVVEVAPRATRSWCSPTTARPWAPPSSSSGARRCSTRCARSWPIRPRPASRAAPGRTGGRSTPW